MTFVDPASLQIDESAALAWVRVQDAQGLLWVDNPKLHDIGAVAQSIARYGFQELPKFDKHLKNTAGGQGAIKAGNGRIEALGWMEKQKQDVPRGIALDQDGCWCLQALVGVDAKDEFEAVAYAVDSNNLTLSGGDFTGLDFSRLWDSQKYLNVLQGLGEELPVSFDRDDVEALSRLLSGEDDNYSRNIEAPIYTPKGEKPAVSDLFDETKTNELLAEIEASSLPDDEKEFLRVAARRHTVLNYKRIADYYSHSSPDVQALMENSALVIIDFNRAIELGYVRLSEQIAEQYRKDYGDE